MFVWYMCKKKSKQQNVILKINVGTCIQILYLQKKIILHHSMSSCIVILLTIPINNWELCFLYDPEFTQY